METWPISLENVTFHSQNRPLKHFGGTFMAVPSCFPLTHACRKILGGENALHLRLPFCSQLPFNQLFDPQNTLLGVHLKSPPKNLNSDKPATEASPEPFPQNKKYQVAKMPSTSADRRYLYRMRKWPTDKANTQ